MPTSPKHAEAVAVEDAAESRALPAGWTLATISELIGRGGKFTDGDWVESKDQDPSGDIRLIQLADVGDGVYLDKSSRFLTAKKSRDLKCTYLVPGDVLGEPPEQPISTTEFIEDIKAELGQTKSFRGLYT